MFVEIQNDGPQIISSNYWDTEHAMRGFFFLSINAGAFRLLVPDKQVPVIGEWMQAREVIVSRGPWPAQGKADAIEILFEDDTDSPYALHIMTEQTDRLPTEWDRDRHGRPPRWKFSVWTRTGKVFDLPCRYRVVKMIPYFKKWE